MSSEDHGHGAGERPPLEREFSAGGVVVRDGQVVTIVPTRRDAHGNKVLALPKGHLEPGETAVDGAEREVREETGIEVAFVDKLGDVRYWYQRGGHRIFKVVTFFLFDAVGGRTEDHDHEVEEVRWVPLADAAEALSYDGERQMVARALARAGGDR
jgi:8-oxo-dGTP pyrophosphatase MutT (NUDIX family)